MQRSACEKLVIVRVGASSGPLISLGSSSLTSCFTGTHAIIAAQAQVVISKRAFLLIVCILILLRSRACRFISAAVVFLDHRPFDDHGNVARDPLSHTGLHVADIEITAASR